MWFMKFETPQLEDRFVALAAEHGGLFKRGAYNFAALAHDEDALTDIEAAASNAFVALREELEGA
jgi:glutamate-1-semialdehyde 2,1-aminomutase